MTILSLFFAITMVKNYNRGKAIIQRNTFLKNGIVVCLYGLKNNSIWNESIIVLRKLFINYSLEFV